MEREYFDARFDGLEKLMTAQMANLSSHIGAVSANGKATEAKLEAHQESTEAHGRKAADGALSNAVAWLGFGLAAVLGAWQALRDHR